MPFYKFKKRRAIKFKVTDDGLEEEDKENGFPIKNFENVEQENPEPKDVNEDNIIEDSEKTIEDASLCVPHSINNYLPYIFPSMLYLTCSNMLICI